MCNLFEKDPFLEKVSTGKTPVGLLNYLRDTVILSIARAMGFDFVVIDNKCTGVEQEITGKLILAAELNQVVPFVRVLELTPYLMRDYIGMDARGILVLHIRSGAECRMTQEALRYPPYGNASCCRSSHADEFEVRNWMKYLGHIREPVFVPMIEDPEVTGYLDGILDELKPGRDMAVLGGADYGQACGSLNVDGTFTSEVNGVYLKVMERCRTRSIGFMACPSAGPAGQIATDVKEVIEEGCSAVVLNADRLTLAAAFGNIAGPCLALDIKK